MSSKMFVDLVAGLMTRIREQDIESVGRLFEHVCANNGRIYLAGNGGSAATAQHFANDLLGAALRRNRRDLSPICLCSNMSTFTALSNDYGYENVFVKQLEGRIGPNDLLFLISVSGDSENCVAAARYARSVDAPVVSLLGSDGGALGRLSDDKIVVETGNYYAAESCHLVITHAITHWLDSAFVIEAAGSNQKEEVKTLAS